MTTQQQTTHNPWFMLGKGKGEKASCKCRVWKFWATDAICLKQTGGAEMSQVHSQWLLEDVVLSPMTKNSNPGSFFAMNPKCERCHRSCNVSAGSSPAPSPTPAQTETPPAAEIVTILREGEAHLGAGSHSQSKKSHTLFSLTTAHLHLSKWFLHL